MRYGEVRAVDIANGEGQRTTLYVTGCNFHCKGCFNEEFQDFKAGKLWNRRSQEQFIRLGTDNPSILGYSILGGEPLMQDTDVMLRLVKAIKETGKTLWMWTGFKYENLNDDQKEIVKYVDVLVDGQFEEDKRDPNLRFRGSWNQRVIDVQETLKQGVVVEKSGYTDKRRMSHER